MGGHLPASLSAGDAWALCARTALSVPCAAPSRPCPRSPGRVFTLPARRSRQALERRSWHHCRLVPLLLLITAAGAARARERHAFFTDPCGGRTHSGWRLRAADAPAGGHIRPRPWPRASCQRGRVGRLWGRWQGAVNFLNWSACRVEDQSQPWSQLGGGVFRVVSSEGAGDWRRLAMRLSGAGR